MIRTRRRIRRFRVVMLLVAACTIAVATSGFAQAATSPSGATCRDRPDRSQPARPDSRHLQRVAGTGPGRPVERVRGPHLLQREGESDRCADRKRGCRRGRLRSVEPVRDDRRELLPDRPGTHRPVRRRLGGSGVRPWHGSKALRWKKAGDTLTVDSIVLGGGAHVGYRVLLGPVAITPRIGAAYRHVFTEAEGVSEDLKTTVSAAFSDFTLPVGDRPGHRLLTTLLNRSPGPGSRLAGCPSQGGEIPGVGR